MNNRTIYLIILPILLCFLACQTTDQEEESFDSSEEALNHKQLPFDLSSFQRAYPDKSFDVKGYKTAFAEAMDKSASRSLTAPDGFSAEWTTQGPGNAGARINVIEIDPNDDDVIYIGYSGGGVFKTTNDGNSWTPVFDDQPYLSIGAIEVDPNDSDVVYVGTGDPNITGYPFIGNGVYKSEDGGDTWTESGLANTGVVSKIIIDPEDSNTIYTSTMGNPFTTSADRGVYKSTDAGASWTNVLFISDQTGVIDMDINPDDPDVLYATGWDRVRSNQVSINSGNGGRIYRTENGGSSWEMLDNGLPIKELSRSSIAVSPSDPDVVYASIIDSTYFLHGIYRSDNGGDSWDAVTVGNSDNGLVNSVSNFGWYFGRIFVNPTDDETAYLLGVRFWATQNEGDAWSVNTPTSGPDAPHVDNHYVAFNSNGDLYLATDGGLYKNPENTDTWIDMEDIPATQIYRVGYNPHEPNTYYGGCQDNGTQAGNANDIDSWVRRFGADGFQPVFHPTDPNIFYFETQNGNIWRTNDGVGFSSYDNGINPNDRVNWDMPYMMSAQNSETLYAGTHRVYRHDPSSSPSWYPISGDLTDGNIYGAAFHTISTIHESPVNSAVLYAGTTDGNVHRSNNTGASWTDITTGLPNRYVTCIKADPNNPNEVYVSHSGYKYNEEIDHIHFSTDQGNTWIDISGDLPQIGINHIEVMPNYGGSVLFAATDAGVYATLNGGTNWDRLGTDYPFITTYDLDLNVANNQLIAGTFGRSIMTFPLDSIGVSFTPPPTANISGNIKTHYNDAIEDADVEHSGTPSDTEQTNASGDYSFNSVTTGQEVTVTPEKDDNYVNGVTGFDIVLIKRHILKIDTLGPYDIIASDINNSGQVTSFDLVFLSKLILNVYDEFPTNNSWRFVRSDYIFPDPEDPFPFPESVTFNPLFNDQEDIDFVGVKIGDVNQNADGSALMNPDTRSYDGMLDINAKDQFFKKGETVKMVFSVEEFSEMLGYQFTLKFDEKMLAFNSIESLDLANVGSQDFETSRTADGVLTMIWTNALPVSEENVNLFQIEFLAKADGELKDLVEINSMRTTKEAYKGLTKRLDVQLAWAEDKNEETDLVINDISLLQNTPNPLQKGGVTTVVFTLPTAMDASFELFDANGKVIWTRNQNYTAGQHQIELSADIFGQSGVYYYQLKTKNGFSCTKRILFME